MVDSGESTKAVVTNSEVRILSLGSHVECKQHAFVIHPLRQAVKNTRNQQHMAILDGTNLLYTNIQKLNLLLDNNHYRNQFELLYNDGKNTGRILSDKRHAGEEPSFVIMTSFELEEHLFLANFSEVELAAIERLQNLIHTKLGWSL